MTQVVDNQSIRILSSSPPESDDPDFTVLRGGRRYRHSRLSRAGHMFVVVVTGVNAIATLAVDPEPRAHPLVPVRIGSGIWLAGPRVRLDPRPRDDSRHLGIVDVLTNLFDEDVVA